MRYAARVVQLHSCEISLSLLTLSFGRNYTNNARGHQYLNYLRQLNSQESQKEHPLTQAVVTKWKIPIHHQCLDFLLNSLINPKYGLHDNCQLSHNICRTYVVATYQLNVSPNNNKKWYAKIKQKQSLSDLQQTSSSTSFDVSGRMLFTLSKDMFFLKCSCSVQQKYLYVTCSFFTQQLLFF